MELTECLANGSRVGRAKDTGETTDIEHLECTSLDSAEHQFATPGAKPLGPSTSACTPAESMKVRAQIRDDARDARSIDKLGERGP